MILNFGSFKIVGEINGVKMVINLYKGNFKMKRGDDTFGIESLTDSSKIKVIEDKKTI